MAVPRVMLTRRWLLCSVPALLLCPPAARADVSPQDAVLVRLCDIVLPDTDTPGARAAGVPGFLPFALSHDLFGGNAETLPALTRHLDARAGGGGFLAAGAARQLDIVTALDHATFRRDTPPPPVLPAQGSTKPQLSVSAPVDNEGQRLWRIVKSGIVTSFYTSESGGSRTLAYDLVPGRYDASIPLHSGPYLSNLWIENLF